MGALRERAHYTEGAVLRQARRRGFGCAFRRPAALRRGLPCAGCGQPAGLLYNAAV